MRSYWSLKGGDIREQFGVNQWPEQKKIITSLDLAKRTEILPRLRQVHWDLVIVDEAHRMSSTPPDWRRRARAGSGRRWAGRRNTDTKTVPWPPGKSRPAPQH